MMQAERRNFLQLRSLQKPLENHGYTILEVMIVIGISAFMFISIAYTFGGRQQEVQFTQAVRDFDSRLQDTINDITTGFFNNDGSNRCVVTNPSNPNSAPSFPGGVDPQGQSEDCVFIGKVMQFIPNGGGNEEINILNIVGRRENSTGVAVSNLDEANPRAVTQDVENIALDWGLRVTGLGDSSNNYASIGFFTSFSRSFGSGLNQTTVQNTQAVRYVGIPNSVAGETVSSLANKIANVTSTSQESILICLEKSDRSKKAAILLGEEGSASTTVLFDDPRVDAQC